MKRKKIKKYGDMNDSIGKRPSIKSKQDALKMILALSLDKRTHFLLEDAFDWLNLKMIEVSNIAKIGLKKE